MSGTPHAISSTATTRAVVRLLDQAEHLDWKTAKVCDVGAGRGHFSHALSEKLIADNGADPAEHVFPCDLIPDTFEYDKLACTKTGSDGKLPYEDDTFDATVSIEVIEHVEDQFHFLREMARVTKPNGIVIVTTPNTLNLNSRLRTLLWGFPGLYDPLPLEDQDIRFLGGHIHPISPYFLAYGALRAGLYFPRFVPDRTKRSAVAWSVLLWPFLAISGALNKARIRRKRPELLAQNAELVEMLGSRTLLTARTAVMHAIKSETPMRAR